MAATEAGTRTFGPEPAPPPLLTGDGRFAGHLEGGVLGVLDRRTGSPTRVAFAGAFADQAHP
ncbi:hypothetical protein [Streptomyces sp. SYSU K21746]